MYQDYCVLTSKPAVGLLSGGVSTTVFSLAEKTSVSQETPRQTWDDNAPVIHEVGGTEYSVNHSLRGVDDAGIACCASPNIGKP